MLENLRIRVTAGVLILLFSSALLVQPFVAFSQTTPTASPNPTEVFQTAVHQTLNSFTATANATVIHETPVGLDTSESILLEEDFEDSRTEQFEFTYGPREIIRDGGSNRVYEINNIENPVPAGFPFGQEDWDNYAVEFDFRILDFRQDDSYIALFFRETEGQQCCTKYILSFWPSYRNIQLSYDFENTGWEQMTMEQPMEYETDRWYHVRVEAVQENINVYVDSELVLEITDEQQNRGRLGLQVGNGIHIYVDNVRVLEIEEN
jgi:hypothetical protein